MITEIFIGIGALLGLWWTLLFILFFGVLAIVGVFLALWLLVEWVMTWRIFHKKWWVKS